MRRISIVLGFFFVLATASFAQKGIEDGSKFGKGEDSIRAVTSLSLFSEFVKQKNYEDALPYFRIVFFEAPRASKNIYIRGVALMQNRVKTAKDQATKNAYIDTLMMVYDQRIKYYGNDSKYPEAWVLGRKGMDLYNYAKNDVEKSKEAIGYMERSLADRKGKTEATVCATLMVATVNLFKNGDLPEEKVVEAYMNTMEAMNAQLSVNKTVAEAGIKNIETMFLGSGAGSCEKLIEIAEKQYKTNSNDVAALKRTVKLLKAKKCDDSKIFFAASEKLYSLEPSAVAAYGLAKMSLMKNDHNSTIEYFNRAIELEESSEGKAKYCYELSSVLYDKKKDYAKAKSYALKAADYNPNWGQPYILIGNMYAGYSKQYGDNEFENKTLYWAAVDKFVKAKTVDPSSSAEANKNIALYSKYFPDKEELFFQGFQEGQTYKIGSWINETTKTRAAK